MAKDIGGELIAGHKIVRPWLGIRIETLGDDPSIRDLFKGATKAWWFAPSKRTLQPRRATCVHST
jgi:hypothetical protein